MMLRACSLAASARPRVFILSEASMRIKRTDSEAEPMKAIIFPLPSLLFSVADKSQVLYQAALMDQARRSLRPCARTRGGRRRVKFRRAQCKRGARGRHRPTESHLFQDREIQKCRALRETFPRGQADERRSHHGVHGARE